jgi:hypothetical protein
MQSTNVLTPRRSKQRAGADNAMTVTITIFVILVLLFALGWVGLQVQPAPFPTYPQTTGVLETLPFPTNLPAPVERFYQKVYGDKIPIVTSAIMTGRATIQPVPGGPRFPARFRFTHEAGHNYRHYIEATLFGFPIMRVNETYLDGKSLQQMPWGTVDNAPKANQAANLGMWAELMSVPSVYLTDARVRWEAVDDNTALLIVPFGNAEERFVVRFNPETNLVDLMEVMRYKGSDEKAEKILWITKSLEGKTLTTNGITINAVGTATWLDDGKPWAEFITEEIVLNADVKDYVRAKGL